jgi:hypothetical protein
VKIKEEAMPSTVKVRVKGARNLPLMNSHSKKTLTTAVASSTNAMLRNPISSTDAYVVVSLGGHFSLTADQEEGK